MKKDRNCFIYQVCENNAVVFEGTSKEVKAKYYVTSLSTYVKGLSKLCGKYEVRQYPKRFKPLYKEPYYYYSTLTEMPQKDYWNIEDTNCLTRWNASNVYKTKALALKYGHERMMEIKKEFKEQC